MNKLHIIYVLSATDPLGGATKAIMNLLNGLAEKHVTPLFILPEESGIAQTLKEKDYAYKVLNYRMCVYPPLESIKDVCLFIPRCIGRLYLNRKAAKQLTAIAKDFQADIIHTNTSVNDIGYIASRKLGIPHVWHIREYADLFFNYHHYPSRSLFLRKFRTPQSYTICITKDIQKYNLLTECAQSRVIYDGVLSAQQKYFTPNKENYFLFAGRLSEGKGIEELLHAYAEYTRHYPSPIPLWIAGETQDDNYKKKLSDIVSQEGLEEHVQFLGMRPDILTFMQRTIALIVPSRAEGFGFITAEGMFSGALVIGKNVRGTKEQFDNGNTETGQEIAIRYETEAELTQYLAEVSKNGIEPYLTMIQAGQHTAVQLYSIESHQKAVWDLYCEIVKKETR